jgi:hypothetical protein
MPTPIPALQFQMPVECFDRTLAFQKTHQLGYKILLWYRQNQMDMVDLDIACQYFDLLPFA